MNKERWPFIKELAIKLEKTTMFSAEATEAIGKQFDYLGEEQLRTLLPCIQNIAAAYNIDLQSAADLIRKEQEKRKLPEIIAEYERSIAGAAEAVSNTYYGALHRLASALRDLFRELWKAILHET